MLRKLYLPLIALAGGIASALLAVNLHVIFYVLVPLWAFLLGYFTNWRWGLLYGFLLFVGYTGAMSFLHNPPTSSLALRFTLPFDLGFNFVLGGFSLVLIAGLAWVIRRKGLKHIASGLVIMVLAATVAYCSYTALPRYQYAYFVEIHSPDIGRIEAIYLPLPAIADEPSLELLEYPFLPVEYTMDDYSLDLVDTDYGLMLRVSRPPGSYLSGHVSLEFKQLIDSYQTVQLLPSYEGEPPEFFTAPLGFVSDGDVELTVDVSARVRTQINVNFYNFKSVYYAARLEFEGSVSAEEWVMAEGQAGRLTRVLISGASGY